jgi:hypothetical protein
MEKGAKAWRRIKQLVGVRSEGKEKEKEFEILQLKWRMRSEGREEPIQLKGLRSTEVPEKDLERMKGESEERYGRKIRGRMGEKDREIKMLMRQLAEVDGGKVFI